MFQNYKVISTNISNNYTFFKVIKNGKYYFVKKIRIPIPKVISSFNNEIIKYKKLKNFEILPKMIEYNLDKGYIIYQYIDHLSKKEIFNLSYKEKINVIMQIVDIIIILHSNGIVHCDLKLSNFVITPLLKVYLIDLDNSKFVGEFNDYGTLKYCSIDQINGSNVTYQFDIYALGIITYELLLNKKAFSNMNSEEIIEAKRKNNIILDKDLNKKLILKKIINKATNGLYNNIEEFKSDLLKLKRICGG